MMKNDLKTHDLTTQKKTLTMQGQVFYHFCFCANTYTKVSTNNTPSFSYEHGLTKNMHKACSFPGRHEW